MAWELHGRRMGLETSRVCILGLGTSWVHGGPGNFMGTGWVWELHGRMVGLGTSWAQDGPGHFMGAWWAWEHHVHMVGL